MVPMGRKEKCKMANQENKHVSILKDGNGLSKLEFQQRSFDGDFPVMKTSITTTEKFGKLVSTVFKSIFNDYSGCFLTPGHNGDITFSVYFVKDPNGTEDAEKTNGIRFLSDPRNYQNIMTAYASRFSRRMYELTDDCKEILDPFIEDRLKVRQNKKIDGKNTEFFVPEWNRLTSEVSDNNRYRTEVLYGPSDIINLKVTGLDIYKFLRFVYGDKDGESEIDYRVRFEAPLSPTYNGTPNRILVIDRIKKSDIGKILNYKGRPMRTVGGINKYY